MQMQSLRLRVFAVVAGVAILAFSGWAGADPPSRVARLGYMSGAVSFSPAGENDWDQATINRPLTTGDRLWTDAGGRAEIQVGGAMIRMSANTGMSVLNLDDRIAQLQLTQGTLNVRVHRLDPNQVFEVDTPNLAFTLRQAGAYRIEVDPDGNATTIVVRKGQGEVYGEGAAYTLDSRQAYRFTGTGLREYQLVDAPRLDEFDRWASARDRSYDNSASARYVSPDVVGYQDLDANGTWRADETYGNVWIPNRVAAGWAPYRDGHWAWVDPWGWTWVDDAPWGFAVSHYGRWASLGGTWGWVPGPVRGRAYYAPALVAFVGGNNFQLAVAGGNVGGVAWFPLGPREVYRPSYPVSRGYFENINRSNTVINTTVINNTYNNTNVSNVVYANRHVPGAVVAVPTTTFVQSQPVSRAVVRVSREVLGSAPVAVVAPFAPTEKSVRGAAAHGGKPPPRVFERPVLARTAPAAAHAGFAAQRQQLTAQPGKPLDDAARKELKPAAAPIPVVKVVAPTQEAPRSMRPPQPERAAGPGDGRGKSDERTVPPTSAISGAAGAPAPAGAPWPVTRPVPAAQAPEQRGKSEQRGRGEQRGQAVAPPPVTPHAAQPQVAPRQVTPPAPIPVPAAPSPEPRGRSEQRGNGERRGQAVAPPAQHAAEPKAVPPQVAPPAPAPAPQPHRSAPTKPPPAQPVAPPEAAVQQAPRRAKPEPVPAARQAEPRPVAAPKPTPAQPAPKVEPVPKAERRGQEPRPAAGEPKDTKRDGDEPKRDDENRKRKE